MLRTARRRAALLALAGLPVWAASACSSADAGAPATSSSSAAVRTLAVTVNGKLVTPAPTRVRIALGQTLRLVVTADHDDELHAHGFEVERELKAGVPLTLDLTTKEPGLYEVELHHPEL